MNEKKSVNISQLNVRVAPSTKNLSLQTLESEQTGHSQVSKLELVIVWQVGWSSIQPVRVKYIGIS